MSTIPEPIDYLLQRKSPFSLPSFEPDTPTNPETKKCIAEDFKILVIGAGGLGCEILKDLALSGFKNIHVIDLDTIDVSNLNRQFLFRQKDVGQPKAVVAAEFINKRVKDVNVVPHFGDIRDQPDSFYQEFAVIIAGLDSIKARRWINATLVGFVEVDDEGKWDISTAIPLIDGGTEAFKGQSRVVIPRFTSCLECSLDLFPADPLNFQMCTLAERPRQPEHCIEYILRQWERGAYDEWKDIKLDKDNAEHMAWIYEKAFERAQSYSIEGVTLKLTQGVVKRIIPAIASTNAIISAACVNEVFKIASESALYLDNYMAYNGTEGIYTNTFQFLQNPECSVCGTDSRKMKINPVKTLQDLINELIENPKFQFITPSIVVNTNGAKKSLYVRGVLEKATRGNLEKSLESLFEDGDILYITDPSISSTIATEVKVQFVSDDF